MNRQRTDVNDQTHNMRTVDEIVSEIDRLSDQWALCEDMGLNASSSTPYFGQYTCRADTIPLLLEPIDLGKLEPFRRELWEQAQSRNLRPTHWSAPRAGDICENHWKRVEAMADNIIDYLTLEKTVDQGRTHSIHLGYSVVPSNPFMEEFVPRMLALATMRSTLLYSSIAMNIPVMDSMVDEYLRREHGTTLADFRKSAEPFLPDYRRDTTSPMAKVINENIVVEFIAISNVYLGILASMNRDLGIQSDLYCSELKGRIIFPPMWDDETIDCIHEALAHNESQ